MHAFRPRAQYAVVISLVTLPDETVSFSMREVDYVLNLAALPIVAAQSWIAQAAL